MEQKVVMIEKDSQIQKEQLSEYSEEKKHLLDRFERLESEKFFAQFSSFSFELHWNYFAQTWKDATIRIKFNQLGKRKNQVCRSIVECLRQHKCFQ